MNLASFAAWLGGTAGSIALHESQYLYSFVETAHVVGIALFVGTIAMVDLRLLGVAFPGTPVSEMNRRMLPWTVLGFALMFTTGLLLFYAIPVRSFHSLWFRLKVLLMLAAALNVWIFHRRVQRDRVRWDAAVRPPAAARFAAAVSLVLWCSVVVAGRMIAYNWADCDKPQPPWVRALAQCAAYPR